MKAKNARINSRSKGLLKLKDGKGRQDEWSIEIIVMSIVGEGWRRQVRAAREKKGMKGLYHQGVHDRDGEKSCGGDSDPDGKV